MKKNNKCVICKKEINKEDNIIKIAGFLHHISCANELMSGINPKIIKNESEFTNRRDGK